jgi:hypothetical protein
MYYIIDRIENNYAVCENSQTHEMKNILLTELPNQIKQGNVIKMENGIYILDKKIEEQRKAEIREKIKNAWKN